MKKRVLSIFLACVMLLSLLPTMALAEVAEGSVAKIGDTGYATIKAALENVKTGETIVLLKDIDTTEGYNFTAYWHAGKSVSSETTKDDKYTLDFNGYKINLNANSGSTVSFLTIGDCEFTFKDSVGEGGIFASGKGYAVTAQADKFSTVIRVEGGTLSGSGYSFSGSSGTVYCGAGIYVGVTGTNLTTTVNVNEGTVNCIREQNESGKNTLNISGGTITGWFAIDSGAKCVVTGGTFDTDPKSFVPATGCKITENEQAGTWTVEEIFEAQIGDKTYTSLADAIAAANEADTTAMIVLLDDITLTEANGVTVNAGKDITIDLAGHNIAANFQNTKACAVFNIANNGKLTMNDSGKEPGEVILNSAIVGSWPTPNVATNVFTNEGTLVINGGYYENKGQGYCAYVVDSNSNTGNTSLTVNGGKLVAQYCPIRTFLNNSTTTNAVLLKDGEFEGRYIAYIQQPSDTPSSPVDFKVEGGTYNCKQTYNTPVKAFYIDVLNTARIDFGISGGKFANTDNTQDWVAAEVATGVTPNMNVAVSSGYYSSDKIAKAYIAEDYECVENTDTKTKDTYKYVVRPMAPVAKIGNNEYTSLAKALAAVPAGNTETVTIELLKDIVLTESVNINKNYVTIDGKKSDTENYTISADPNYADFAQYKVDGANQKFGSYKLLTVSGSNVTVKNLTVDVKDYRGMSCLTTTGGTNVTYENVTYQGRGSGHYYGTAASGAPDTSGTVTFKNCKFNTQGYAINMSEGNPAVLIDGCIIKGWNSFGDSLTSVTAKDSYFYGAWDGDNTTPINGLLAKFRPYCPTTITNCKFSEDYLDVGDFCGIDSGAETKVDMNGCSVIKNDGTASDRKVYELINYKDNDASKATIFAIDAAGTMDGYTAGTFVTQTGSIALATNYKLNTLATNVYQVVPFDKVAIPAGQNFVYDDGNEKNGVKANDAYYTLTGTTSASAVGKYTATATLKAGYQWADGTTTDKEIKWEILKQSQPAPAKGVGYEVSAQGEITAKGGYTLKKEGDLYFVCKAETATKFASPYTAINTTVSINAIASPANMGTVSITGVTDGKCKIGTSVTVTATAGNGFKFVRWEDDGVSVSTNAAYNFTATTGKTLIAVFEPETEKTIVQIPVANNKTYDNGNTLTGVEATTGCTVTDNTGINADTYTATATLENAETSVWADGTTAPKTITWVIYKATQDAPTNVVGGENNITGVAVGMEYMAKGGSEYTKITTGTSVTGLNPGTYYVRFAGDDNHLASPAVVVTVSLPTITVTTIQPEVKDKNSAKLYGSVTPYDATRITKVGFRYSTDGTSWTDVSGSAASASFIANISGLTADTKYIAQAYVTTNEGTIYGAETTFYTLAEEPTGEIDVFLDKADGREVTLTIEKGNSAIASVTFIESTWKFNALPDGFYNIVVRTTDGDFTETRLVEVTGGKVVASSFSIPAGKIATVVEVKNEDTPAVAVGGLSEILTPEDKDAAAAGNLDVEIKLEAQKEEVNTGSASPEPDTTAYAIAQIEKLIPEATATVEEKIETVLDLSLIKTTTELENNEVKSVEVKDIGSENNTVIEVAVPYATEGKTLKVYRYHDGVAKELTLLSSRPSANFIDGTYFIGDGYVFIYASGFSTYAISYEETKTVSGGGGGVTTYAITGADTVNGKLTVDKKSATAGSTVTITVSPDKGFTLETLTVTDKNGKEIEVKNLGSNKYSFKMPSGKVSISATFMEDNSMLNFFVDVKATDYYYDAVLWAAENDITKGTDAVHFSPDMGTTRAQVVTFLWRAAGCPEAEHTAAVFKDVSPDAYYVKAVEWALSEGITKGTSVTMFSPDAVCTRGQIVTFLARFAGVADEATGYTHGFTDVKATDYFNNAVAWAKDNKVTEGTSATTFSPNTDCTRAQVVTFLYRWMVK